MADDNKAEPGPKWDPIRLAIPVADRVMIDNVMLSGCEVRRSPVLGPNPEELTFRSSIAGVGFGKDVEKKLIFVMPSFALRIDQGENAEGESALSIKASFVLVYSVTSFEGIDDENLGAFSTTNGVYNAWPYWREFVQSTSARMGLPAPIIVPVFRLGHVQIAEQARTVDSSEK